MSRPANWCRVDESGPPSRYRHCWAAQTWPRSLDLGRLYLDLEVYGTGHRRRLQ